MCLRYIMESILVYVTSLDGDYGRVDDNKSSFNIRM